MRTPHWNLTFAAVLAAGSLACSESTTASVGLAFSTRQAPGAPAALVTTAGDSTMIALGNDTIIVRSVELVLREIELELLDDLAGCPDSNDQSGLDDDACEEFSTGIVLVTLPLGSQTEQVISVNVPAGIYDEVEFEIHKPEQPQDAAFIAANPAFANVAIRVTGTFSQGGTRSDFVYTTDLNEEQEIDLNPPLDVTADGPVNLTIRLDVGTWFLNAGQTAFVDPASANNGGANEGLVENNIKQSIEGFHDDDSDGLCDDTEDDDHGSSHDAP
jgi:hypothetical protein